MNGNQITISTLTVSSINNGTPGVAAYSTFNASSINATSTTTTSTLITGTIATTTGFTTIGQNTSFPNRSIEIGADAANSVYLDFHSSDSAYPDYSTRIQSNGGSTIGQGHMMIQASTINIVGTSGVGIGTSTPLTTLNIYNTTADSTRAPDGDNRAGQLTISNSKTGVSVYSMAIGMDQVFGIGYINAAGNNTMQPVCLNTRGGSVGIGITNPTGKCHIYGSGQSTGTGDVYSLNVSSADSFNGNGGITVYSESINLKAGDLTWNPAVRVHGARIYIGGGYSINGAQNQGNIIMYTGNAERARITDAGIALPGLNMIHFGYDVAGKEANAGKMGYQLFTAGALDIVGAGTGGRTVKIWDSLTVQTSIGIGTNAPNSRMDIRGGTAGVVYWANPVLNVYGNTDYDASNVVNIQCQASQYGRNILYMTGRYEGSNDGWSFGAGRNIIMFQTQSSLNSAATQRFQIQNFANQLGILSNGKGSTPITVWNDNGNVGIGLSEPGYLLHVGSITSTYNMAAYLGSGGPANYGGGSITHATSLYINAWGISAAGWGVISDKRVKTNIEPVSDMLSIIKLLNVVKYDYIDPRLGREECSVIAQELQTIFPNAINITTDYLPNIMKLCTYTKQDTIVTLSVSLQSTPDNLNDIKVGSILKLLISNDDTEQEKEITTPILSISFIDHTIQVSSWVDYSDTSTVVVYGTQVDNFLSIDKPQLGVMALQGVKELVKQNADLQAIIDTQAAQIATILARLNAAGIA
jgi:hypothetical protein